MNSTKWSGLKKDVAFICTLVLWIITAWLLYPLINLDAVHMENAKEYFYRSALGIIIMIIFFGKTILDLLFPQVTLRKIPLWNTILLTLYSIALGGGIIFIVVRMITLYLKSRERGFIF